jgi:hypothetical protein
MKYAGVCAFLLAQLTEVSAAVWRQKLRSRLQEGKQHTHDGLEFSFEIKNYNYYDLTKTTCPDDHADHVVSDADDSDRTGHSGSAGNVAHAMDEIFDKTGSLDDFIHKGMDAVDAAAHEVEHGVEVVGHEIEKDAKKAKKYN